MPSLTREEAEAMMRENLERISYLMDSRFEEFRDRVPNEYAEFQAFQRNYKVYSATNLPVLPRGTMIVIDTRPAVGTSGVVAKYTSLGDRYVEEWAKQVNP